MLASTRKVSSAASDELRQYRRARCSNAAERHDSSPGGTWTPTEENLCCEISLNSAPPVVAGGVSLAVVTARILMWRELQERNYYEHLRRKFGETP
jgi:hypothetical protein